MNEGVPCLVLAEIDSFFGVSNRENAFASDEEIAQDRQSLAKPPLIFQLHSIEKIGNNFI
jgi:hypothetical protein